MGRQFACALGALAAVAVYGQQASGALVTPTDWTRGAANTTYQEWNVFTSTIGPNAPDVGVFNPNITPESAPNVFDTLPPGSSFVTSGGNIYSPGAAILVDVDVPHYGLGSNHLTTVLLQVRTIGSELNYDTVRLTYAEASEPILPLERIESDRAPFPGFGGFQVDNLFRFVVPFSPSSLKFHLDAAESSVSLDRVVVDTFTNTPEPGSGAILVGAALMGMRRRRGMRRSCESNH